MDDLVLHFDVDANDLQAAGEASASTKLTLKKLGLPQDLIRRIGICMYEGEINMVIHADGGTIEVRISLDEVTMTLADRGPGIPDVELAMQEGYSTAGEKAQAIGFGAGMGLPNMKKNADELIIDTTVGVGTTITMKVRTA